MSNTMSGYSYWSENKYRRLIRII
ncbi:hypothetical protein MESS2_30059 [Mesorhizobium metallidurans STM 2683]|uniref:Uncharacterized protein n=1 Tax=Mesorhizobium metallidurans STM 2683 TaxID=1297569 RepID=M5EQ58_9HYPH|nr:hypothetical protein MESS2_30059 [Mesorhizobium metallidurans STM 2683]